VAKSLRAAALPEGSEVISIHRHIAAGAIAVTLAAACPTTAAPALAAGATVTAVTQVSVSLSWPVTPDADSYLVTWDGGSIVTPAPEYTDMSVPCATTRSYTITPQDANAVPMGDPSTATATTTACPASVALGGHDVFMFYYPWYRTPDRDGSWAGWQILPSYDPTAANIASDFWPLGGPYSVSDPATLDRQFAEIRQSGANVVVESWDGPGSPEDQLTPEILDRAAAAGLRVAFQLEPYPGRSAATLASDIAYLNSSYGAAPAFYRSPRPGLNTAARPQGQGLFLLYNPNQSMWPKYCAGCITDVVPSYWKAAIDAVHASAAGGIVLGTGQYTVAELQAAHMDGGYLYAELPTTNENPYQTARQWELAMPPNGWAIPSVTPGFANDCAQAATTIAVSRQNGTTYDGQWAAMWNGPPLDDIAITSFNEWHEGTQIEPSSYGQAATGSDVVCDPSAGARYQDYGSVGAYGYLYRTNDWVQRFAASPLPTVYATRASVSETLGAVNTDTGLSQLDTSDGVTTPGFAMGRTARAATSAGNPRRYMYFSVQNQFAYAIPKGSRMTISVTLLDTGGGPVSLMYDGAKNAFTRAATSFPLTGGKKWRTLTWKIPDAYFGDRENSGTDLRLLTPGDRATWVSAVTISRS
jgi:hypothetical protein